MGCDIHSAAEVKTPDGWKKVGAVFPLDDWDKKYYKREFGDEPFDWRSYGMFGFLADVRNYSHVPCVQESKHDIPADVSKEVRKQYDEWSGDAHSASWLTLRQLKEFNYDQVFWDRRVTKQTSHNSWNGAALADEGEGEHLTVREFLGEMFFKHLAALEALGEPDDVRVVFWFDN